MNTDFKLRYVDTLIERPALMTLLEGAIKGNWKECDVDAAFKDMKASEQKYFAKLLTRIWTKSAKKRAAVLLAEETKNAPKWVILPKKAEAVVATETVTEAK